jgi:hypothetical protein
MIKEYKGPTNWDPVTQTYIAPTVVHEERMPERASGIPPDAGRDFYEAAVKAFVQPMCDKANEILEKQVEPNPKTLMGNMKVPNLSVVPFTGLIHEARAMQYGAYHAPRKDGQFGYGPFNWRDNPVEYMTYIEAALRRHPADSAFLALAVPRLSRS